MAPDTEYMIEAMATDLAEMLAVERNLSAEEALDILYNSTTYAMLKKPETGLYFQSPKYVYSYLKQEIAAGKIG